MQLGKARGKRTRNPGEKQATFSGAFFTQQKVWLAVFAACFAQLLLLLLLLLLVKPIPRKMKVIFPI